MKSLWRERQPFRVAVARELARFERLIHRVWQILSLAGVLTGVIYALAVSRPLGLGCAATAALFLVWFVFVGHLYDRGQVSRPLLIANTVVEGLIPWVFMLMIVYTMGADYALGSWVPPFLFCACICAYVPRLDPLKMAVLGAVGAVVYLIVYFALVADKLTPQQATLLINQPATQISRSMTLFISGCMATLLIFGLRQVIATAGNDTQAPAVLGSYRLLRALSDGVHEAVSQSRGGVERRVLLEYVPTTSMDPGELMQQVEIALRVVHPNVVQVLDFGRHSDAQFDGHVIVSEYVEGVALGDLMRSAFSTGASMPPQIVAHVGAALLAGLDHLHRGVLAPDGRPLHWVVGFDPDDVAVSSLGEIKLTGLWHPPSLRQGTRWPTAVAPELAHGAPLSEQSDLYALGVTLWELLAGEHRRPEHAAVRLTSRQPRLDRGWDAFFLKVLAPEPSLRPASARQMAAELEAIMSSTVAGARERLAKLAAEQRAITR